MFYNNIFANAASVIDHAEMYLSKIFRAYCENQAARTASIYFKLPELNSITSFHMPTIGARKRTDPVEIRECGYLKFEDPLYSFTRIWGNYDQARDKWVIRKQKLRLFETELTPEINNNAGQSQTYECETGFQALEIARRLFQEELYETNPEGTAFKDRTEKKIMGDHTPAGSTPYYLAQFVAHEQPMSRAGILQQGTRPL